MIKFEKEFFRKFDFEPEETERHFQNALRDLEIARKDPFAEVRFTYSYQALIKTGIALIAQVGKVKVRSVPGHHVRILEKISGILADPEIAVIGDAMRTKRNADLYSGGELIGEKEAEDYLKFVEDVIKKARKRIQS